MVWALVLRTTPPLKGKQWMVLASLWRPSMRRWAPPHGPYLSRGASAYPAPMNKLLAESLITSAVFWRIQTTQACSLVRSGRWSNSLLSSSMASRQFQPSHAPDVSVVSPSVNLITPLRPADTPPLPPLKDEKACVCGLADCWKATR